MQMSPISFSAHRKDQTGWKNVFLRPGSPLSQGLDVQLPSPPHGLDPALKVEIKLSCKLRQGERKHAAYSRCPFDNLNFEAKLNSLAALAKGVTWLAIVLHLHSLLCIQQKEIGDIYTQAEFLSKRQGTYQGLISSGRRGPATGMGISHNYIIRSAWPPPMFIWNKRKLDPKVVHYPSH